MEHPLLSLVDQFLAGRIDLSTLTAGAERQLAQLRADETESLRLTGAVLGPIAEYGRGHRSNVELRAVLEDVAATASPARKR